MKYQDQVIANKFEDRVNEGPVLSCIVGSFKNEDVYAAMEGVSDGSHNELSILAYIGCTAVLIHACIFF